MPHESKRGDLCGFKRGGRKQLHNTYMSLFEKSHQGAAVKSPARSVRQLIWVFAGLLLYTPLEVRSCAYIHTIETEKSTANRSHIGLFGIKIWGRYCKCINRHQKWKINKKENHQSPNFIWYTYTHISTFTSLPTPSYEGKEGIWGIAHWQFEKWSY